MGISHVAKGHGLLKSSGFLQLPLTGWLMLAAGTIMLILGIALKVQTSRLDSERASHAATKAEYATFVSETKRLGDEAKRKADAERKRQAQVNQRSAKDYEKRIAGLAAAYQRLLGDSSGRGSMSRLSDAAAAVPACSGPDAARFLDKVERGVLGVLEKGDREIAKHIELWKWNEAQGKIGATGEPTPATPNHQR